MNSLSSNNTDRDYGEIYEGFSYSFTITNTDEINQSLTMITKFNGNKISEKVIQNNVENTFSTDVLDFNNITVGELNSVEFTISNGAESLVITLTFTRIEKPNNAPTMSSLRVDTYAKDLVTGSKVTLSWDEAEDLDGDIITYDIYFYNGSTNLLICSNYSGLTYEYIIPKTDETTEAKFKVRAYDKRNYSEFIESEELGINIQIEQECGVDILIPVKDYGEIDESIDVSYLIGSNNANNDDVKVKFYIDGQMVGYIVNPFK